EAPDELKRFDEQLRIVGPDGEVGSNLKYSISLADGTVIDGVTDVDGMTQRLKSRKPARITQLTLTPPENAENFCCAAKDAQAPMVVDLTASEIFTNDTEVDSSKKTVVLPRGKKRPLTIGEIAMARTIFKDAVNYEKVKVHHGGWWLFFGFQNTAVTPNGEMYFPESTELYRDDFSSDKDHRINALFMHEMTHVWQYQLGYPVKSAGVTVTSRGDEVYKYTLSESGTLSDYNMEQQGEIISDYFIICVVGDADKVWSFSSRKKDPRLLKNTVAGFLANPTDKKNLPR
ncbi:type VI secretion system tip protein VgrG, partial [Pseudomonas mandelii]|nr:type VI secretion system tip protein VgrG [Pseudomonas mandelii]